MNFDYRYQKFLENIPDRNLSNYLGLIDTQNEKSTINFLKSEDYLYLNIEFRKVFYRDESNFIRRNYIGLPMEINNIIAKFILEEKILTVNIVMFYPQLYPFCRPIIDVYSVNTNFKTKINLTEFYRNLCDYHNRKEWHSNITIDKDILDLYISFNKFEYILIKN